MANFNIIENGYTSIDAAKKDWIKGIRGDRLRKKHNMTTRKYTRMLKELEDDGYKTGLRKKKYRKPSHIAFDKYTQRFIVKKMIDGKVIYGGCFRKRCDAEKRVIELDKNGWDTSVL